MGKKRFRPLTGILFFNECFEAATREAWTQFPSPYGDFVFQPTKKGLIDMATTTFPSPYGDFVFQRTAATSISRATTSCFRPLTGILFFNCPSEKPCHSWPKQAVCGAEAEISFSGRCRRAEEGFLPCVARRGADAALFPNGGYYYSYSPLRRRFLLCCRLRHQKNIQSAEKGSAIQTLPCDGVWWPCPHAP